MPSSDTSTSPTSSVVPVLTDGIPDYSLSSDPTLFGKDCYLFLGFTDGEFFNGEAFEVVRSHCQVFPRDYLIRPLDNKGPYGYQYHPLDPLHSSNRIKDDTHYDLDKVVSDSRELYLEWYACRERRGDFKDRPRLDSPGFDLSKWTSYWEKYAAQIYGLVKGIFEAEAYRTHARMNPALPVEQLQELEERARKCEEGAREEAKTPRDWGKVAAGEEVPDSEVGSIGTGKGTDDGGSGVYGETERGSEDGRDQGGYEEDGKSFDSTGSSYPPTEVERTKGDSFDDAGLCDKFKGLGPFSRQWAVLAPPPT